MRDPNQPERNCEFSSGGWETSDGPHLLEKSEMLIDVPDERSLAIAIADTVREPMLVLDRDLRVILANRAFCSTFDVDHSEMSGRFVFDCCGCALNIPALRTVLKAIMPENAVMNDYEVNHEFPRIGRRVMLLNARKIYYEAVGEVLILLAFEDVTERRSSERALQALVREKAVLLDEMQHRIANSLQMIASMLSLKARLVESDELRLHLDEAQKRVLSIASVQRHLQETGWDKPVDVGPYLSTLCRSLADSMIGDERPVALTVVADLGAVSSRDATSIGLIVTETVINALKHAFPVERADCRIVVSYQSNGTDWTLSIADNGVGKAESGTAPKRVGLGTSIVKSLAQQLNARMSYFSGPGGTVASIVHLQTAASISAS